MKKLGKNQKVTVYYNDITLGDKTTGHTIHMGCPSVRIPWRQAVEYADKKISTGEWSQYIIPDLNSIKCYFAGEDDYEEDKKMITCPNKCSQEIYDEDNPEGTGMFRPYYINGLSSPPEHVCIICGEDAIIV